MGNLISANEYKNKSSEVRIRKSKYNQNQQKAFAVHILTLSVENRKRCTYT